MEPLPFMRRRLIGAVAAWIAVITAIVYCTPAAYRTLPHWPGDLVLGFRGGSHELVSLSGMTNGRLATGLGPGFGHFVAPFYRGPIHCLDTELGKRRDLPLAPPANIWQARLSGTRLCCHELDLDDSTRGHLFCVDMDTGLRFELAQSVGNLNMPPHAWRVSDDGQTAACNANDGHLRCYDLSSGGLIRTLKTRMFGLAMSPSGKLVSTLRANSWHVAECRTGRTICELPIDAQPYHFSQDDALVQDIQGLVWDLAKSKKRFRSQPPPTEGDFAAGGRLLVEVRKDLDDCLLSCREVQSGKVLQTLNLPNAWRFRVKPCTADGRFVEIDADSYPIRPSSFETWLMRLPFIGYQRPPEPGYCIVFDAETNRIVFQGSGVLRAVSDDGRYAVTEEPGIGDLWKLWELPVRKPWGTIALWALLWSVALLGIGRLYRKLFKPEA